MMMNSQYVVISAELAEYERMQKHLADLSSGSILSSRMPYTSQRPHDYTRSHQRCVEYQAVTVIGDNVRIKSPAALRCWSLVLIPMAKSIKADIILGGVASATAHATALGECYSAFCNCYPKHRLVQVKNMSGLWMYSLLSPKAKRAMSTAPKDCVLDQWIGQRQDLKVVCVVPFATTYPSPTTRAVEKKLYSFRV